MERNIVSFIIPCYNSSGCLKNVVKGIADNVGSQNGYQVILVNDHSSDNTWEVITEICGEDNNVVGISLARNFGQQSARMAALEYVRGDFVVFMDDDGQHDPVYIPKLISKLEEGYDIVYAKMSSEKKTKFRKWGSYLNRIMAEALVDKPKNITTSSFFVARRFVVEKLKDYQTPSPYLMGFFMKITHNIANIPVCHKAREYGKSGYNLKKLLKLWMNGFVGFSVIPLRITSILGVCSMMIGILWSVFLIIKKILFPEVLAGYTTIVVLILVFGGLNMLMLGLVGEYVGRMFMAINKLPQFAIRETCNASENDDK